MFLFLEPPSDPTMLRTTKVMLTKWTLNGEPPITMVAPLSKIIPSKDAQMIPLNGRFLDLSIPINVCKPAKKDSPGHFFGKPYAMNIWRDKAVIIWTEDFKLKRNVGKQSKFIFSPFFPSMDQPLLLYIPEYISYFIIWNFPGSALLGGLHINL